MTHVRQARWIRLYSVGLIVLIIVYYMALLVAGGALLQFVIILQRPFLDAVGVIGLTLSSVLRGLALLVVFVLLLHLAYHFVNGVLGLITRRYDTAPETTAGISLARESYPELWETVDAVAGRVKASAPHEVRVIPDAVCFVAERRRFSFPIQRDLVLAIGMPQLTVLTVTELQVILAHELAHLHCDTELMVFVFRFVESLRDAQENLGSKLWRFANPIYRYCKFYYKLFLMLVAPIQRRQELLADQWSAAVYGGETAAQTLLKDWLVTNEFEQLFEWYAAERRSGRPPVNIFQRFAERWHDYRHSALAYLERRLAQEEKSSFSDSHPTMATRLLAMRQFPPREPPQVRPADSLVPNIEVLQDRLHKLMANGDL
jgi:Zn-dependent protease with chaperone function